MSSSAEAYAPALRGVRRKIAEWGRKDAWLDLAVGTLVFVVLGLMSMFCVVLFVRFKKAKWP